MSEEQYRALLAALADLQVSVDAMAVDVERITDYIGVPDDEEEA